MDRINPPDQLAAIMRAQLASLRSARFARTQIKGRTDNRKAGGNGRTDAASIAAERISSIDPNDSRRAEKALRVFLECVLVSEFGPDLVSDPAFGRMVDHVEAQLQADPELREASTEAARQLLDSVRA